MNSRVITSSTLLVSLLSITNLTYAAVASKQVCYGDNDMNASTCFQGITLNTSSRFSWKYMTGSGFWNSNARVTTYADNGLASPAAAKWKFKTGVKGEVWFSVWVPSTNATARMVYYNYSCGSGSAFKKIDQLYYSAQWVTLGGLGEFPAGTTCSVTASKYLTADEIRNGGKTSTKMAIDGMKMTIY